MFSGQISALSSGIYPVPFVGLLGPGELMGLVMDSTFFGKGILLILLVLSVLSWAILADKGRLLMGIKSGHSEFWKKCDQWLEGSLSQGEFVDWCDLNNHLPLANQIMETHGLQNVPDIRRASERVTYLEMENLERYLILLSTAVTISPFLGLLGTVWGIMSSFFDMSAMQSANLAVVAPGIAEALVTTIAGLATAIPAVIFYNMLVRKIDLVANEMERLRTVLEERAGGGSGAVGSAGRDLSRRPEVHGRETI
ncbi:MAG: MotA/TolQ/ExbB proton channel family protein [bacterium]|nr:MotA/TolQ/ExbB proton channel family protein [bacterium]